MLSLYQANILMHAHYRMGVVYRGLAEYKEHGAGGGTRTREARSPPGLEPGAVPARQPRLRAYPISFL